MIQNVLPPVAYLNNSLSRIKTPPVLASESTSHDINLCTTSNHYAIVESDHPYKPATVSNYKVNYYFRFNKLYNKVKCMAVLF